MQGARLSGGGFAIIPSRCLDHCQGFKDRRVERQGQVFPSTAVVVTHCLGLNNYAPPIQCVAVRTLKVMTQARGDQVTKIPPSDRSATYHRESPQGCVNPRMQLKRCHLQGQGFHQAPGVLFSHLFTKFLRLLTLKMTGG